MDKQKLKLYLEKAFLALTSTESLAFICGSLFTFILVISQNEIIKDWQTLISGFFAVIAALLTIFYMKKINDDQIIRKRLSVKASFPDQLVILLNHSENYMKALLKKRAYQRLDKSALQTFINSIEWLETDNAMLVSEMVNHFQILDTRFYDHITYKEDSFSIDQIIYDISYFTFTVNRIFDYARGRSEKITPEKPSLENLIHGLKTAFGMNEYSKVDKYKEFENLLIKKFHEYNPQTQQSAHPPDDDI